MGNWIGCKILVISTMVRRDEAVNFLATLTLPSLDGKKLSLKKSSPTVNQGGGSLMFLGCFSANTS